MWAKTARNEAESPEVAQLRVLITRVISEEFCGDVATGIWAQATKRAADRILEVIARDWKMPPAPERSVEVRAGSDGKRTQRRPGAI